ncbi:MAG: Stp1/IreP family PP2C-type Ser/Thr phosphatase [Armatimonadetes bacterium]|nr:Stp1/IreP family PP2C-type Ser/Thr phosphatase [Armatimonadota bacterium]
MRCQMCSRDNPPDAAKCVECGAFLSSPEDEEKETTAKFLLADLRRGLTWDESRRPTGPLDILFAAKTDMGMVRENNEDKFDFYEPEAQEDRQAKGAFYAVADGMGGHSAGQIASEMALKTIIRQYYKDAGSDILQSLRSAIREANSLVFETAQAIPERAGMGTTLTAAVIREDELFIAQVGDSRAYLLRDGELHQLTEDHSWVAEQMRRGALTQEEAASSPFRNVITRSIGTRATIEVDTSQFRLYDRDTLLLCSDGLSGCLVDREIRVVLGEYDPSGAAMRLAELANENGGKDNITVIVLGIRETQLKETKGRLRKLLSR